MPNSLCWSRRAPQLACLLVAVCLALPCGHAAAQHRSLFSFDAPHGAAPSGVARARDGTLYAVTRDGGASGKGAVVAVSGGTVTHLYSFRGLNDGAAPSSVVLGSDGALYGLSTLPPTSDAAQQSALFRLSVAGELSVLSRLNGGPDSLVLVLGQDGALYVSSQAESAVLKLGAYEGGLAPVFRFEAGTWANALVVTRRGELFATTLPPEGPCHVVKGTRAGAISVLADLPLAEDGSRETPTALARTSDGSVLVTSQNVDRYAVYRWKRGSALLALGTLDAPVHTLVAATSGNVVFGATRYGTAGQGAALFQVAGAELTTLARFSGFPAGAGPRSLLATANGVYGSAADGGEGGVGTLFRYRAGEGLTPVYAFSYPNGSGPSSLVLGSEGALYGVTMDGGPHGAGTVFKTDVSGTLETLHAFKPAEGAYPQNVIEGPDGALYGRTLRGGEADFRTLWKLDKKGELTTLLQFTEQRQRSGPKLVQLSDGTLYGADTAGSGRIFRYVSGERKFEEVHKFTGLMTREGAHPTGLVAGPEGVLYGVTRGAHGPMIPPPFSSGTVFRLNKDGTLDTLYAFNDDKNALGALPGGVLLGQDGLLYGSTGNLPFLCNVVGNLFKLDPRVPDSKPVLTHAFTGREDGTGPTSLLQTKSGRFFGLTLGGRGYVGDDPACVVRNSTLFEQSELAGFRTLEQLDRVIGASASSIDEAQASSLIEGADGRLYGTLASGGSAGAGELFVFEPPPPAAATQ